MALCQNCDEVRNEYTGNGAQTDYKITFEYDPLKQETVEIVFWDEDELEWKEISDDDWSFLNATTVRFKKAPAMGQKFIIYRCTDVDPLPATFTPGTAIKAQDLNDNFTVLKDAIEEARCNVSRVEGDSDEKYWGFKNTITHEDQTTGKADDKLDDKHIFDAEAIAARHDAYVQDSTPTALTHEQSGKIWNDTDDLKDYFWDGTNKTWVSFSKSGPEGPPGDFGPPGKVIVSDAAPTKYPAVGDNKERDLESGDLWFDSYNVLMFVYYVDSVGPGQWVSASIIGPQGPPGEKGADGGEILEFVKPLIKTDLTVTIDLTTIPNA